MGRVDALAAVNAVPEWDAVDETILPVDDATGASHATQQVFDLNGRLVLSRHETGCGLTLDDLPRGIYFLRTLDDHQVTTRKIVIQ